MRSVLAALALAAVLAGCLGPSPPSAAETFRFVQAESTFRAEPEPGLGGVCGSGSLPEVDLDNRTILFHDAWPGNDFRVLVLRTTWDATYCGTGHASWATSIREDGGYDAEDASGAFPISIREGVVHVGDQAIERGGSAAFSTQGLLADGRAYTLDLVVHDRGEWPLSGLARAS